MKFFLIAVTCSLIISSCSKKNNTPPPPHKYEGQWDFVANTGSLYFFDIDLDLKPGGTGTAASVMKDNSFQYADGTADWSKVAGDSVMVILNIPAYPEESWEFRGLGSDNDQLVTGQYYMFKKNKPAERMWMGTCKLVAD